MRYLRKLFESSNTTEDLEIIKDALFDISDHNETEIDQIRNSDLFLNIDSISFEMELSENECSIDPERSWTNFRWDSKTMCLCIPIKDITINSFKELDDSLNFIRKKDHVEKVVIMAGSVDQIYITFDRSIEKIIIE